MPQPTLLPAGQALLAEQYTNMNSCVRCGLCHSVCPTYQESLLEFEGPRGRIAIAKALVEGNLSITDDLVQHWDNCILCQACSAVCPSGVKIEPIGQALRAAVTEQRGSTAGAVVGTFLKWLLPRPGLLRAAMGAGRLYRMTGIQKLTRASGVLKVLGMEDLESMMPQVESAPLTPNGQVWETVGERRATVAILAGCIMGAAFGETDRATARVLAANGCRVLAPAGQGCCGALHSHRGDLEGARTLARLNIDAFERAGVDAVIVNAAGCGATMKHYAELFKHDPVYLPKAEAFAAKVKDFSEFLDKLGPVAPTKPLAMKVTYQDACHLAHAQGIKDAPRRLLRLVPGLELKEMAESSLCCGSGALYNVTQGESSKGLRTRKVRNAGRTQAEVLVTANPGCYIQIKQGLKEAGSTMQVLHIADLLDQAYGGRN